MLRWGSCKLRLHDVGADVPLMSRVVASPTRSEPLHSVCGGRQWQVRFEALIFFQAFEKVAQACSLSASAAEEPPTPRDPCGRTAVELALSRTTALGIMSTVVRVEAERVAVGMSE